MTARPGVTFQFWLPAGDAEKYRPAAIPWQTDAERFVARAVARGEAANFDELTGQEPSVDKADLWGPERTLRATFVQALLTGTGGFPKPTTWVRIFGARIAGELDLFGATVGIDLL